MGNGITITIDDFKVGYASLQYLTRLPAKIIIIDKSFIWQLLKSKPIQIVVDACVKMAHQL